MNDRQKPNNSELILAPNRDLVLKKSNLIERGLQLLERLDKPILRLYMNMDKDEAFVDLIAEIVDSVAENKFVIEVTTNRNPEKLLGITPNDEFAIFFINMSRFTHPNVKFWENSKKHIRKSLQVITYLKNSFNKPVIILSTWGNKVTEEMALSAGASYFFEPPGDVENIKSAIKDSLKRLTKENLISVSESVAFEQRSTVLIVDDDSTVIDVLQEYCIGDLNRTIARVTELVNDPQCTARDLAGIITDDPVLGARLLKLVNSYGFPQRISNITAAIVLLGFDAIRNLLLTIADELLKSQKDRFKDQDQGEGFNPEL